MKHVKLFESFENETPPKSITVEMTDRFMEGKNLYKKNERIKMYPDLYYNLGNTTPKDPNSEVSIYFAVYSPEIEEIYYNYYVVPPFKTGETEWFLYLTKKDVLWPAEADRIFTNVQNGELRLVPGGNCNFRKGAYDGNQGLIPGATDHRGNFRIIDVEQ